MKKIIAFLLVCCMLLCSNVFAAELPIEKAWIGNGVFSLSENGNLYYGENLYSQSKDILLQDVKDIVYTDKTRGVAYFILNSGKFGKFSYDYRFEKDNFNENIKYYEGYTASEIIPVSEYNFFFKDNNNNLYYNDENNSIYYDSDTDSYIRKIYNKEVKTVFAVSQNKHDYIFILTNDGKALCYEGDTIVAELENVRELYKNIDIYAISDNDDLYVFEWDYNNDNYITSIIQKNVKKVFSRNILARNNEWLPFVDNNNDLYFYNTLKYTTDLVMENVKDVFCVDTEFAVIDMDNKLYKLNYDFKTDFIEANVKELIYVIGERYFVKSIDDEIITGLFRDKSSALRTGIFNVKSIFGKDDGILWNSDFLIIKNDGSVWGTGFFNMEQKPLAETIYGQKKLKMMFNGKEIELKLKVQNVNNRTMYPFRECLEAFGAKVIWDSVNNCAIGQLNGNAVTFPIGKAEYYVNNVKYEIDTATYIDETLNRTYIPLRYAAEGLGFTVDWAEGELENTISIHK